MCGDAGPPLAQSHPTDATTESKHPPISFIQTVLRAEGTAPDDSIFTQCNRAAVAVETSRSLTTLRCLPVTRCGAWLPDVDG